MWVRATSAARVPGHFAVRGLSLGFGSPGIAVVSRTFQQRSDSSRTAINERGARSGRHLPTHRLAQVRPCSHNGARKGLTHYSLSPELALREADAAALIFTANCRAFAFMSGLS